ncbi:alkaline phosphatase family protein [Tengunoibacter tsumagoiensis]|uniref:Phosphodiesterase n=1 Tax=Tengunoibacter tsumagoiensis TaxID=2014871 RepID=A0A401ZZD0_9CHLR|nr:alkaline phosphatase family protein [Tengunoibacter tsumagoiensis]GCE12220.1 phosphodiesterase [Tengunoibacter tsumagoiensis]
MASAPRLLIIGLDCAEPSLVFERWREDLPTLDRLMRQGSYGKLESCTPAITVPAWSCMMSGRDPGELGIYGFRNRSDRSYDRLAIADGRAVKAPRLWDLLGSHGWKVAIVGVPGTYPPPAVNGSLVSCFLAPDSENTFTYPPELSEQVTGWVGKYLLDVPNFRSDDKQRILDDIYTMCDQRFHVATHLLEDEEPDLLMLVEMGVDRIHHALWKQMDPSHPSYVPDSPFSEAIHEYYKHVDHKIHELLTHCDEETVVLVVSDHGARPLMGGVCINEWLQTQGYLHLLRQPEQPVPLNRGEINWQRTMAWGEGGYYSRIFLNVKGREPQGLIPPADYEKVRTQLAEQLRTMVGPDGSPLGNRVFTPQQLYRSVRGVAPDLIVYLGDLSWRAIGTIGGNGRIYTVENDTGPDDANHAQHGLFIFSDPQQPGSGQQVDGAQIYDILPTLLNRYKIAAPAGLRGKLLPITPIMA